MSKKSGGLLFSLLQFGALSVLGNMTWEVLGLKWPDKKPSATQSNPPLGAGGNTQGEKK